MANPGKQRDSADPQASSALRADGGQGPVLAEHARRAWLATWGVVLFAWGALFASPAVDWLDSGELAAAGASLGVAHPPGSAGLPLLLHAAALLPIGGMGLRMSLLSAALTSLALVLIAERLLARGLSIATISAVLAWTASAWTFAHHMRVVEIYPLAALIVATLLWGLDPLRAPVERDGPRSIAVLIGSAGIWAMGELRLCLAPMLLFVAWQAWRQREAWVWRAPLFAVLGSLPVLSLPLASMRGPLADWGDPQTPGRLWAHLQASSIRAAFADQILPRDPSKWAQNAERMLVALEEDLGPFGPAMLVIAALLAWWGLSTQRNAKLPSAGIKPATRADSAREAEPQARVAAPAPEPSDGLLRMLSFVICVEVLYAIGINPMGVVDRQTGMVVALAGPTLIVLSCHRWLAPVPRARAWLALPVLILGVLPAQRTSWPHTFDAVGFGPQSWTQDSLAQLPPRALLVTQSDDLSAGVLAAQVLDEARPDVSAVVAQHLHKPPPDRVNRADCLAALRVAWQAAPNGADEAERIFAVLTAYKGPIAIEAAGTGVLRNIPWYSSRGALPLDIFPVRWEGTGPFELGRSDAWIGERVVMDGKLVLGPPEIEAAEPSSSPAVLRARTAIERNAELLARPRDRARVARIVHELARTRAERGGLTSQIWLETEQLYMLILEEVDPDDVMALTSLGAVHDRFDRRESAISLTRRALELEPDRAAALRNLALYLSRDDAQSSKQEALELIQRACEVEPGAACDRRREEVCVRVGEPLCSAAR